MPDKAGRDMRIAVIGAGNAGQTLAAYFKARDHYVALYNRSQKTVDLLKEKGTIELTGLYDDEVTLDLISTDIGEVIAGCDHVLVTTPADSHYELAKLMGPYLEEGQKILLNPGRTAGTYTFLQGAKAGGCKVKTCVGETDTLIFTCRNVRDGVCRVFSHKKQVRVAAHNQEETEYLLEDLKTELPGLFPAESVFQTGLSNIGMIFHPAPFLFNVTRIENQQRFLHYQEGITPMVAGFLEKMDGERLAVANALGVEILSAKQWVETVYRSKGENLYEVIQDTDAYNEVFAPTTLNSRYVFEDVGTGLVPFSELGKLLKIPTPCIDLMIALAGQMYHVDFRETGRNAEKVNLKQFVEDCRNYKK